MANCIANGATEFMIVFNLCGAGFLGFGGDDNTRRMLTQHNPSIVGALRSALDANLGSGSKFNIIGFDARLMQALDEGFMGP